MHLLISGTLRKGNAFLALQIHGGMIAHNLVLDALLASWLSTRPASALLQLPILTLIADALHAAGLDGGMKTLKLASHAPTT